MKNKCFLLVAFLAVTQLQAQVTTNGTPRDQLPQLTAQLQQSPNDEALREKIIALALTLNPKPTTPDAATMAEGGAEYAFKNAKVNSDFSDAAKQYEKALLLAPWLSLDYFNCGVAHEKAGENKEAIRDFGLYLLAAPNADDAQAVKKRIGGLQYAAQKAADEAKAAADAAARKEADIRVGAPHGGGIVFYIDGTGQHGFIAATEDQGRGTWYVAVQLCKNYRGGGYADWFMPSRPQLVTLYQVRDLVGGFTTNLYWSTTPSQDRNRGEVKYGVFCLGFADGSSTDKGDPNSTFLAVRAIRAF